MSSDGPTNSVYLERRTVDWCLHQRCSCEQAAVQAELLEIDMRHLAVLARLQEPEHRWERDAFYMATADLYAGEAPLDTERGVRTLLSGILSSSGASVVLDSTAPRVSAAVDRDIARASVDLDLQVAGLPDARALPGSFLSTLKTAKVYAQAVGGAEGGRRFRRSLAYVSSAWRGGQLDDKARVAVTAVVMGVSISGGAGVLPAVAFGRHLLKTPQGRRLQARVGQSLRRFLEGQGVQPDLLDRVTTTVEDVWTEVSGRPMARLVGAMAVPAIALVDATEAVETIGDLARRVGERLHSALDHIRTHAVEDWLGGFPLSSAEAAAPAGSAPDAAAWAIASQGGGNALSEARLLEACLQEADGAPRSAATFAQSLADDIAAQNGEIPYVLADGTTPEAVARAHLAAFTDSSPSGAAVVDLLAERPVSGGLLTLPACIAPLAPAVDGEMLPADGMGPGRGMTP